jgi:hypothetical protein
MKQTLKNSRDCRRHRAVRNERGRPTESTTGGEEREKVELLKAAESPAGDVCGDALFVL